MNILDTIKIDKIKTKSFKKDDVLFRENDKCDSIGVVVSGQISIVSYLKNGKEIVYNTLKENEIFGNNLIFSSNPFYKGNIITNVDSKIVFIYQKELINLLQTNKEFLLAYLEIQSNFTKTLNDKIKLLSIDSAKERLYYYLHENNNSIEYSSVTDLSKELCISRETLSRLLSQLLKKGIISKEKNRIYFK